MYVPRSKSDKFIYECCNALPFVVPLCFTYFVSFLSYVICWALLRATIKTITYQIPPPEYKNCRTEHWIIFLRLFVFGIIMAIPLSIVFAPFSTTLLGAVVLLLFHGSTQGLIESFYLFINIWIIFSAVFYACKHFTRAVLYVLQDQEYKDDIWDHIPWPANPDSASVKATGIQMPLRHFICPDCQSECIEPVYGDLDNKLRCPNCKIIMRGYPPVKI